MKKSQNQREIQALISPRNLTGIAHLVASVGLLIALIGLLSPLCSYNPTILDATKRNVMLADLDTSYRLIIAVLMATTILLGFLGITGSFTKKAKTDKSWKENTKRYIIVSILILQFVFIAYIVLSVACVFYEIPEAQFGRLETTREIGYWLFGIGSFLYALAYLFFAVLIHRVAVGKIAFDKLAIFKKAGSNNNPQTSAILTQKLMELQQLRYAGMITEEEYQIQRARLLNYYQ